jgi:ABC-type spermidine/putrescine transport system permease subunit II
MKMQKYSWFFMVGGILMVVLSIDNATWTCFVGQQHNLVLPVVGLILFFLGAIFG